MTSAMNIQAICLNSWLHFKARDLLIVNRNVVAPAHRPQTAPDGHDPGVAGTDHIDGCCAVCHLILTSHYLPLKTCSSRDKSNRLYT